MKKKIGFSIEEENSLPEISQSQKDAFTKGATTHVVQLDTQIAQQSLLDPKAKPTYGINIRFNEYQMDLIRRLCAKEERSQQHIIKRILIPALENQLNNNPH